MDSNETPTAIPPKKAYTVNVNSHVLDTVYAHFAKIDTCGSLVFLSLTGEKEVDEYGSNNDTCEEVAGYADGAWLSFRMEDAK